jgi:hypothetical protein
LLTFCLLRTGAVSIGHRVQNVSGAINLQDSCLTHLNLFLMNCILIETSAYADLQAHVQRLLERVSALQALTEKSPTVRWLTTDDVCKALSITKRALQYYRSCGIIPYTAIGNKVVFREEDVRRLLEKNLIKAE